MATAKGLDLGVLAAANARYRLLMDWLKSHHAQCNWQQKVPRIGMLECWTANGRVFLVQHYERGAGWEVYIPAHAGTGTLETLAAASLHIRGKE